MKDTLSDEIRQIIAKTQHIPVDNIVLDIPFDELGIDSFDQVNILFALEDTLNITISDELASGFKTVNDIIREIELLRSPDKTLCQETTPS
jgi:acyl carrier protein